MISKNIKILIAELRETRETLVRERNINETIVKIEKNMKNTWGVVIFLSLINVYSLIYSIVKASAFGDSCHSSKVHVYNTNTILNRLITYIVWVLPIIYVFWPKSRTVFC